MKFKLYNPIISNVVYETNETTPEDGAYDIWNNFSTKIGRAHV